MPKCQTCGKSGLFLKLSENGACADCENKARSVLNIIKRKTEYLDGVIKRINEDLPYEIKLSLYTEAVSLAIELMGCESAGFVILVMPAEKIVQQLIESQNEFIEEHRSNFVNGEMGHFGLSTWFLETFTTAEQDYMISRYLPMGAKENSLTEGSVGVSSWSIVDFLTSFPSGAISAHGPSHFLCHYPLQSNQTIMLFDQLHDHFAKYCTDSKFPQYQISLPIPQQRKARQITQILLLS